MPVVQPPLRTLDAVGPQLRPDPPPPPGCVGRGALAGACASTPDHAGSTPVRGRSHASAGPRAKKGRLWSPRKKPPPPHRAPGRVERCGGEQLAWLNAPVTPVTAACPGRAPAPRWPGSSSVRIQAPATRGGCGPPQLEPSVTRMRTKCRQALRRRRTARRVAAATWMMSSTTEGVRGGAREARDGHAAAHLDPGAPPAAKLQADRAARSPDPQPASCRRPFRRGCARAASTRHRWCPRLSGRWSRWQACAPTPGPAGAVLDLPGFAGRALASAKTASAGARLGGSHGTQVGARPSWNRRHSHRRHGTVPERRANVQKGARLSGRRPKVFGAVTRLGWLPKRRRYALACLMSLPKWPLGRRIRGQKSPSKNPL